MATNPETLAHQEWLGYVQPVGLVVSVPALLDAQCQVNQNIAPDHARFLECLPRDARDTLLPELRDFVAFAATVLGWRGSDLISVIPGDPTTLSLEVALPEYHETLLPSYAVRDPEPANPDHPWMLLVQVLPAGTMLDDPGVPAGHGWHASPQARFERLLRETRVPIGLLCNGASLRLVYAPRGESSGHITFSVPEMVQVAGRPIFAALHALLGEERLFVLPRKQRLPALLEESRRYQSLVSDALADQVFAALCDLLRGFQAANDAAGGTLLRESLAADPSHVYHGLLTVLMRLVFLLYAEDRGLVSTDPVYTSHYAVSGLFEHLREDHGRYPDTMDQRYGAWAQLLTLFRLIHEGGSHGSFRIPARRGYLFNPERYPFLEGQGTSKVPRVSDGVVFRILRNLLILDGERLSYSALDVQQIGSVYERMMGFELQIAAGPSIALKPKKRHGAPTAVNLEALLAVKSAERARWLKAEADQEVSGQAAAVLKSASTVEDLLVALERRIAKAVTPHVMPRGSLVFQPSPERRRSGSHYTPRSLTEPIVAKTLEPVLARLGSHPTPEQILALKVCDPAMGSGAFLVEACRQLGEQLVTSWRYHQCLPAIPPDEDEELHARRLVAQRCLYGVDKNPLATDLAKLSLWLATLAKDHPFTFLDHSLRSGDSLVGLTKDQIAAFHWSPAPQQDFLRERFRIAIDGATAHRRDILAARDDVPYAQLEQSLTRAERSLSVVRFIGDAVVGAFFSGDNARSRETRRSALAERLEPYFSRASEPAKRDLIAAVEGLRSGPRGIAPFHWEIEFPEVLDRENPGFDAVVGNPPFLGGRKIRAVVGDEYLSWLATLHDQASGNADVVAHFFRRGFVLLRKHGCSGLIATNTIGQGDTRSTGLQWICENGGDIYQANRRVAWPGSAAVVVSIIHISKAVTVGHARLDGRDVAMITAFLFHAGGHRNPGRLASNAGLCFQGSLVLGMGFTFDDSDPKGVANPLSLMKSLIEKDASYSHRIQPFIGGEEVNESPTHSHSRFVIRLDGLDEETCYTCWPNLMRILEAKVRPERLKKTADVAAAPWWQFWRTRPELYGRVSELGRVLAISQVTQHIAFAFLRPDIVYSHRLYVVALESDASAAVLQSRIHEIWARFFGSSLEERYMYAAVDCFETFPFPNAFEASAKLNAAGRQYYDFRADLMVRNNQGLTKTYNRFHDPDEHSPDILKFRELHAEMDRAVLEAYGWHDLADQATCEFILDYEDEDDEESSGRRRKKPWRYRWPDDFRDEVLARLLELNRIRAEEEKLAGEAATAASGGQATKRAVGRKRTVGPTLPGMEGE